MRDSDNRDLFQGNDGEFENDYDLQSLIHSPDFLPENNHEAPFPIDRHLRLGRHEEYLRVSNADRIDFTGPTRDLMDRSAKLGLSKSPPCFREQITVSLPAGESSDRVGLRISVESGQSKIHLTEDTRLQRKAFLEVWEAGEIVRKVTVSGPKNRLLGSIKEGSSLILHVEGQDAGSEILLTETEFSTSDWKSLFLHLALSGDLGGASRVLTQEMVPTPEEGPIAKRVESFLHSLIRFTKPTAWGLSPIPLLRGPADAEARSHSDSFPTLRHGLETCWPGKSENGNRRPDEILELEEWLSAGEIPEEVRENAISGVMTNPPSPIGNAWGSFIGWTLIEERRFKDAEELLERVEPIPNDPFSILPTYRLASHLSATPDTGPSRPDIESSDSVFLECLDPMYK